MESEDKKPIFTKRLILIVLAVILLILIIFLLLRKCGGGGSNYQVQSITLSPTSVGIDKGQNYPIYAYVLPDDAKDKSLIWSSSDENVATVDAAGLVTGVNEGTATITATAGDGSGVTGQCVVTVGSALPNLEQIQLNKSTYSVKVGKSVLVEVTPIPSTAQLTDIQYSIADTSIATVDMYGTIKGVKKGTTTLTVTANNGGVTATATVKVTKSSGGSGGTSQTPTNPTDVAVTGINLPSDGCYKLRVGNEYTLTASLVPVNATNQELKWESSDTSIATVTATGKVIASTKQGTVTIKATAKSGVYSTYEIRVVSKSSKEGSCSSSSNNGGGGSSGNGGSTGGGNEVTTPNVGEVTGDGVLTEATAAPVYNNHTYNLTINGYIQSNTIHKGTDGWMQDANCSISINGILPPYYKATYQAPGGSEVEFRTRAYASDITGPVKVRVYIYDRLVNSDNSLNEIRTEYKEVTVCGKVNGKDIHIDNQAPSCDSITYSGTDLNNSIVVSAHDEGGSGLHKIDWENGDTTTFSGDSVTRSITSQFNAGTRRFVATIYDKAGNATACGINVTDLNGEGSTITSDADLASTLKNIKLSVGQSTLYPGSSTSITATGEYEDGTTANITDSVSIDESSVSSVLEKSGSSLTVIGDADTMFGTSNKKTVTFKVTNGDKVSNSVTVTILKNGRVSCTPKNGTKIENARSGDWYTGDAGAICDVEPNTDTKITKIGVCFASLSGTCTPSVKSITAATSATASIGRVTGQGKICVAYVTNKNSATTTECFGNQNFDNTAPSCTVSIDGSVFMYKIDDGNDSSGLNKLTGKNPVNLNGEANATTHNFRYTGSNKPTSSDAVSDMAGNQKNCSVPNFTEAQLQAMQDAAAEEDNNGQLYITQADVTGEMWVCQDSSYSLEDCPSGIVLNSNTTYTFAVGYEVHTSYASESVAMSLLGALKKYDTTGANRVYEWKSGNTNVIQLSSSTGQRVSGKPKGVGSSTITVCLKGTSKCASKTITVSSVTIAPKSMYVYHSSTMALGVRENLSVSVSPYAAKKDVIITSSNSSVISVENNSTIVARGVGKATLTVKAAYNTSLVKTIPIEVIGKDTTNPTAKISTSQVVENSLGKYMYVYFQGNDTESNITMKYNVVKGSSCTPSKKLDTSGRTAQAAMQLTSGGTYTACIEVVDAAGNNSTNKQTITANLPEAGAITCSVSGTTSGQIEVGTSKSATITCTSNEEIKVNHSNVSVSGIGVNASATSSVINSGSLHKATFKVTINAYAGGTPTVTLNAGAVSTASKSSAAVKVGSYTCVGSDAVTDTTIPKPSISFYCSNSAYTTSCKYNVRPAVSNKPDNIEAVAICLTTGSSCTPTDTTSFPTISKSGTYKFCARYRVNGKFGPTGCSASKYIVINKDGEETPSYEIGISGPSSLTAGKTGTLRPTLTADFTPTLYGWVSNNKSCVIVTKTGDSPTVTAANVSSTCTATITLTATDAKGNKAVATKEITVTPAAVAKPSAPSLSSLSKKKGGSYTTGTWSNDILIATISSASGTTIKYCTTTSGSSCTPGTNYSSNSFTFNLTSDTSSGYRTYCAVAVKDGVESSVACKTYSGYKIDRTSPRCTLSLLNGKTPVQAKVTENTSGIASVSSGWTNPAANDYRKAVSSTAGTYSFSFTVKDNAGNQGSCSLKVTVSKSCPDGYSIISSYSTTKCLKLQGIRPWGDWDSGKTEYIAINAKPSSYVTKQTSQINKAYSYEMHYTSACSSNSLSVPCYKKITYTRSRNGACPDGSSSSYNAGFCYYSKSQITSYQAG